MNGYGPETFGELNAATYDERHDPGTTDQAVELLATLAEGGRFVIETYVPDLSIFENGASLQTRKQDEGVIVLEAAAHDAPAQRINYQYIRIDGAGVRLTPLPIRYAFPDEIDQMAGRAGFDLEDRFGDWEHAPFTHASAMHVSIYKKR